MERIQCRQFIVEGRQVDIYPGADPDSPIIYLNTFPAEGELVRQELEESGCPDHSLVAVSGLEWNHDMAPWDIEPISKNDTPCTGGAGDYLDLLTEKIVPEAEAAVQGNPSWRGLAGYSLAGLFAVYAMYHSDLFHNIASMSGSFWFPGFKEYAVSHKLRRKPEHLYFSLGGKESRTGNPYLRTVRANTEELASFYQTLQIDTKLLLNRGGHFTEATRRTALGIQWLLSR